MVELVWMALAAMNVFVCLIGRVHVVKNRVHIHLNASTAIVCLVASVRGLLSAQKAASVIVDSWVTCAKNCAPILVRRISAKTKESVHLQMITSHSHAHVHRVSPEPFVLKKQIHVILILVFMEVVLHHQQTNCLHVHVTLVSTVHIVNVMLTNALTTLQYVVLESVSMVIMASLVFVHQHIPVLIAKF